MEISTRTRRTGKITNAIRARNTIDPAVDLREAPDGEERSSVENSTSEVSSPNQRVRVFLFFLSV